MEDLLEDANEIQEIMGRSYGTPEVDEADLDAGSCFHALSGLIFLDPLKFTPCCYSGAQNLRR
jgi:charged multivesicular body protein 5